MPLSPSHRWRCMHASSMDRFSFIRCTAGSPAPLVSAVKPLAQSHRIQYSTSNRLALTISPHRWRVGATGTVAPLALAPFSQYGPACESEAAPLARLRDLLAQSNRWRPRTKYNHRSLDVPLTRRTPAPLARRCHSHRRTAGDGRMRPTCTVLLSSDAEPLARLRHS